MIVLDTSAIMAIVLDEPQADACIAALEAEDAILISAGTVAEALIVSARRNVGHEVASLIDGLGLDIVTVTRPRHGVSPRPTGDGAKTCIRPPSILATASPTRWRRNMPAASSMSAMISRRLMSKALFEGRRRSAGLWAWCKTAIASGSRSQSAGSTCWSRIMCWPSARPRIAPSRRPRAATPSCMTRVLAADRGCDFDFLTGTA